MVPQRIRVPFPALTCSRPFYSSSSNLISDFCRYDTCVWCKYTQTKHSLQKTSSKALFEDTGLKWLSSECGLSILELTQAFSPQGDRTKRVFGSWGRALMNGLLESQEWSYQGSLCLLSLYMWLFAFLLCDNTTRPLPDEASLVMGYAKLFL